ncbi:MAG: glycosyltransferase family 2 protein [Candidatus Bathyarchaeota archaeon]|nr:glycosyltransferase family 2 protein [Candidatus Bathyarchaeota archaeon]
MKPVVSVVICVRNGQETVGRCIESLLNQTFQDFEIVIVDDASDDRTVEIITSFKDARIRCFKNMQWLNVARSRNRGLKHACGNFIFFTDADCTVSSDWIQQGLKCFSEGYAGVEGRITYVSEDYRPNYSDYILENATGGQYMTGNVAYTKKILEIVGGFNENLRYHSDRDLGLRVKEHGSICYNKNMTVVHPQVALTANKLLRMATQVEDRVYLFRRFHDKALISWRIFKPFSLAKIFFPALILGSLFSRKFGKKSDFHLLPYTYIFAILERLNLWIACARSRVFLI